MSNAHLESVTLKEYFERILAEYKKTIEDAEFIRSRELDRRLENLNGEAERLKNMQATYLPRTEYSLQYDHLKDDIEFLKLSRAELRGKASQTSVNIAYGISFISIILGLISMLREFLK
jgi:hypothetical protein